MTGGHDDDDDDDDLSLLIPSPVPAGVGVVDGVMMDCVNGSNAVLDDGTRIPSLMICRGRDFSIVVGRGVFLLVD